MCISEDKKRKLDETVANLEKRAIAAQKLDAQKTKQITDLENKVKLNATSENDFETCRSNLEFYKSNAQHEKHVQKTWTQLGWR